MNVPDLVIYKHRMARLGARKEFPVCHHHHHHHHCHHHSQYYHSIIIERHRDQHKGMSNQKTNRPEEGVGHQQQQQQEKLEKPDKVEKPEKAEKPEKKSNDKRERKDSVVGATGTKEQAIDKRSVPKSVDSKGVRGRSSSNQALTNSKSNQKVGLTGSSERNTDRALPRAEESEPFMSTRRKWSATRGGTLNRLPSNPTNRRPKSAQSIGISRRCASLSSMASQYNLSTGRYTPNVRLSESVVTNAGYISQYGQTLYDCVLVYLMCPYHKKLAMSKIVNKGLYLPFSPINSGESWVMAAANLIHKISNMKVTTDKILFTDPNVIDILRLQVPIYFEFITRVAYYAKLTKEACNAGYCSDNSMIAWFAVTEVNSKAFCTDYLGPEPAIFYMPSNMLCREITIVDVLLHIIQPKSPEGELLQAAGYTETDILQIYADFLQHCYPSEFMTSHSFKTYMTKWEIDICTSELSGIFKSFAFNENRFINFNEFILGLAMIDKCLIKHENPGRASEFQTSYYFRYYAKRNQQYLSASELARLVNSFQADDVSKERIQRAFGSSEQPKVTRKVLHSVLGQLFDQKVKVVMPDIFHCNSSPLSMIREKLCYPPINLRQISHGSDHKNAIQAKLQRARELCPNCRRKQYTLSVHMVKMTMEGHVYEPVCNRQPDVDRMSSHRRILSERHFTKSFVCNQMVDMIRSYACKLNINQSKVAIQIQDWDQSSVREHCVDKILKICLEAKSLFQNYSRVLKVSSPCYVIGDLHGNLHDLLVYEKAIWKLGPYFNPANYLFLGDYVDRGDYSVECILYLLCMKLLVPDRIFMIRGNHECRSLQKEFTFYNECKVKFGDKGEDVWEAFNDVFDVMPLCAVIDESIFCAHGGIPSTATKIEQIMALKLPMRDPETDSDIALEILWNDPVTNQEYLDLMKNSPEISISVDTAQRGFLPNTKRGTASYYSEDAVNNFLNANVLSHVIRAHEVIPAGYQYHMGGKCLTVFSCSRYCGGINEAAVAFVHDSKIRVMKVDT